MRKVTRFFRSRFFFGAVCILLQVLQMLALFLLLHEFILPVTMISWGVYLAVLLYLINRDEVPEFKLLWVIIFFFSPVIGVFLLLLASGGYTGRRLRQRYQKELQALQEQLEQTDCLPQLQARHPEAWAQASYLSRVACLPCHKATKTAYFPLGEEFHAALLRDLAAAESFIFLQYFIIQQGSMWDAIHALLRQKVQQGVAVYVMYDDLGCIATLPSNYYRTLRKEGIHCVPSNQFRPVMSALHNNRDHRKIAVIDGKVGYTGGINLADEYVNAVVKYGHWKDTAVRLEGSGVQNLTAMFLAHWNSQGEERLCYEDYMRQEHCPQSSGYVIPFGDGPAPIYPDEIGKNVYLNMIHSARQYLYIATPYLICDREVLNALRLAAKKGVDVRLVTPHIPDKRTIQLMTRSNYKLLLDSGVKIYEYAPGFIHAKNFLCDDVFGVCGTINMDYRSLAHHFECAVWMYKTECLPDMKADFTELFEKSLPVTQATHRLRWWQRLTAEVMKVFSPLL